MKKIFLIVFLGSLLFPLISLAGTYIADGFNVYYEGLIPCGKDVCMGGVTRTIEEALKEGETLPVACTRAGGEMYSTKYPSQTPELPSEARCQFCHLFVMLDGIIDFVLFQLVPPLAILMLVIAGIMYIIAHFAGAEILPEGGRGGPAMYGQAKRVINSVIIGLLIIYTGWLIINLFFQFIGVAPWTGLQSGWFSIKCPIALP